MEDSILYDLLASDKLYKYRKKLENDDNDYLSQSVINSRKILEKTFNEEQLKLIDDYSHNIALREESINFQVDIMILNYGVKIGLQLQQAFDEFDT